MTQQFGEPVASLPLDMAQLRIVRVALHNVGVDDVAASYGIMTHGEIMWERERLLTAIHQLLPETKAYDATS
jgi:hypothetical protein